MDKQRSSSPWHGPHLQHSVESDTLPQPLLLLLLIEISTQHSLMFPSQGPPQPM